MELAQDALVHDFRRIDPREARVLLIEAGPRLVPMFDPSLSESARAASCAGAAWKCRLNVKVTDITERGVFLGEEFVPAANVIWAAGVRSSPLSECLAAECDGIGRVEVEPDCSLPGHPEVFVIGDQAHYRPAGKSEALPAVGGVALQQANHVARLLQGDLAGTPRRPFKYFDRGQMATVTRHHALVEVRRFRSAGCAGLVHVARGPRRLPGRLSQSPVRRRALGVDVPHAAAWLAADRAQRAKSSAAHGLGTHATSPGRIRRARRRAA